MSKTTLNFFGEEAIVDTPKDILFLRAKISEQYLLSKQDASEIILYYVKDNKKIYIINGNDFSKYKESKISTIYLDVNQNSKLYLDSANELDKESQKNKKELEELNKKFKDFSKKKENIEHAFEDELKQICLKILELNKRKCEIIKKKDIELIKMIKEKEHFEIKMYYLQKKLSLPITVPIPKDEKTKQISLKNSSKQIPMLKSFQNSTRSAPIINLEIQKRIESAKCRAIASAKAHALKISKIASDDSIKKELEIEKKIKNSKIKSINKAKANALKVAKKAHEDLINKNVEINKIIEIVKKKSIAKAKSESLKVGNRAHDDLINKIPEIENKIEAVKLKSVAKAKSQALKVGKKYRGEILNKRVKIYKKIESSKLKSITKAKSEALKVGKRAHDDLINKKSEIEKKIKNVKLKSVTKAKNNAINVGKKYHDETEIKKRIELVKSKAIPAAKLAALKVGEKAKIHSGNINIQNIPNTVSVFKKVNEVLINTVSKVKEFAKDVITNKKEDIKIEEIKDEKVKLKKLEEEKQLKEKEKKEQIEKIVKITKEAVNEINNLTKMVITQSNMLIDKINNPEKYNNISPNEIILKSSKKDEKKRVAIHFTVICDGCKTKGIRGNRYKCTKCPDFDFCENCYQKNKESHGHEFKIIEKPANTRRLGHKNTKYCSRLIGHKGIRCEGCGLDPFVGYRYMCAICDDYNLCENCEENFGKKHKHPFIKINSPYLLNSFNNCYIKMNYYEPNLNQ